jgi:hypothetical protein
MKNLFTVVIAVILTASAFSQAPNLISYQAVIRNSSNALVVSNPVGIQISILQGSPTGTAVYVETQTTSTNANGLISIQIGGGTVVSGNFATINWANGTYFIETQTDPIGGTDYTITGTSQILSVPYALHSNFADSITGGIKEKEPAFNSSVAKSITVADTTNWSNKLSSYTETEPTFNSSVAKTITASDTINWNNKLSSYTETDPIFNASVAKNITAADTINWNAKSNFSGSYSDLTGTPTLAIVATTGSYTDLLNQPTLFNGEYSSLTGIPTFATVATSGSYTDLSNKPTIPAAQVNSDWNSISGVSEISNKPTLATVATSGSYTDLTNKPIFHISITGDTLFLGTTYFVVPGISAANPPAIGTPYQGGKIAYILKSGDPGYVAGQTHGLIAATSDQSTGIQWYNGSYITTGATGTAIGTGMANTNAIIAAQGAGIYAASICKAYNGGGYSDWYLPSLNELNKLYINQIAVGGFSISNYWSSTEINNDYAWYQSFSFGNQFSNIKVYTTNVRAVRAF